MPPSHEDAGPHGTCALAPGVEVGEPGNPIVHVPGRGSLAIDAPTHDFLLRLANGEDVYLDSGTETASSIVRLQTYGVLSGDIRGSFHPPERYAPELTDLVLKRNFPPLRWMVSTVGGVLSRVLGRYSVFAGAVILVAVYAYWIIAGPVEKIGRTWVVDTLVVIAAVVPLQVLRLVLHEAGHFGVAHRHGIRPEVGVGLYITGVVAYVDLTPLDVAKKEVRVSADLAGLAVDGWLAAVLTILYWGTHDGIVAVAAFTTCTAAVASSQPFAKGDAYWLLRDLMGGRHVTFTWARPAMLVNAALFSQPRSPFALTLLLFYVSTVFWIILTSPRWVMGLLDVLLTSTWEQLVVPGIVSAVFVSLSLLGTLRKRSSK